MSSSLFYNSILSLDTATLSGSYIPVGALAQSSRIVKIVNNSNVDVLISTNGSTDMDFVPASSFTLYDAGANSGNTAAIVFPKGTAFSAKGSVGTGLVYVVSLTTTPPT